ncbi:glycine zipper 2TM domain-containing protein [Niveibacterium terrae]|uniref:glycine zipper 2TM domain-containing protein n=1 Tax=Niveibacterium terrae TaxID=3373598 RepID=UPI003A8E1077
MKKLISLSLFALLTACAAPDPYAYARHEDPDAVWRASHGRITAMERVEQAVPVAPRPSEQTSGAGAVLGGVVGGVVGHQVGRGSGRDVATAVGVIAGAVIGNQVEEQNARARAPEYDEPPAAMRSWYKLTIQLDNGGQRIVSQQEIGRLLVGDRVRLVRGRAYAEQGQP